MDNCTCKLTIELNKLPPNFKFLLPGSLYFMLIVLKFVCIQMFFFFFKKKIKIDVTNKINLFKFEHTIIYEYNICLLC